VDELKWNLVLPGQVDFYYENGFGMEENSEGVRYVGSGSGLMMNGIGRGGLHGGSMGAGPGWDGDAVLARTPYARFSKQGTSWSWANG